LLIWIFFVAIFFVGYILDLSFSISIFHLSFFILGHLSLAISNQPRAVHLKQMTNDK